MQIALLILQIITLIISVWLLRLTKGNGKKLVALKEKMDEIYAQDLIYYQRHYGKGTYAVVKEWFDTHNCTAEYIQANNLADAFLKCEPIDEEKGTIINIYKVD